jgi:hypothetical protein
VKYAPEERFEGSMGTEDPRSLLSAAGGSIWPTVPAYRLRLGSSDASGWLSWLNDDGILFQMASAQPGHDSMIWNTLSMPTEVYYAVLVKTYTFPNDYYTWSLQVLLTLGPPHWTQQWTRNEEKTNIDHPVPEHFIGDPQKGYTGTNCKLWQVEHDQTEPPWGWPPVDPNGP